MKILSMSGIIRVFSSFKNVSSCHLFKRKIKEKIIFGLREMRNKTSEDLLWADLWH